MLPRVEMQFTTASEDETRQRAAVLAREFGAGTIVLLSGDLGAGKTAFVKGLAAGLELNPDDITSPTFTLVHEYTGGRLPLVHVDLYRLDRADLDEIGLDQDLAARGIVAIEWSDRLSRPIAQAVKVQIEDAGDDRRLIRITSTKTCHAL